jgi:hypothetical protein
MWRMDRISDRIRILKLCRDAAVSIPDVRNITYPMMLCRVSFVGIEFTDAAKAALTAAGAAWEGSDCNAEGVCRHSALVGATTEQEAIATLRRMLGAQGSFRDHDASPVRDSRGEVWRGPLYRSWDEIDWQTLPRRARLTELQRAVLRSLLNAAEPTWIIAADPEISADRASVEAVLNDLQEHELVYSVLEEGGEPGKETEPDRWWAVTDAGWDLLGLIKSPRYR